MRRLRRWWWQHVRRHEGEICDRCGRPVWVVWLAADLLWMRVAPHAPTGSHAADKALSGGAFCIPCFDAVAEQEAITLLWVPETFGE